MKALIKTSIKLAVSISVLALVIPIAQIHAQGPNLILNPDAETGDTTPSNWNVGSWGGTVVTSTYATTDGSTGKALGLSITTQGTGDAKWYNDAVAVTAGSTYTLTDSYKSTISSDVILQYTLADLTYSYDLVASLPASTTWTTFTKDIIVPANATNVSVFHLISQVGDLWTDNYSLTLKDTVVVPPVDPTPTPGTNLVLNPSFETAATDTTKPANWGQGGWGTNTTTFEYANVGNTGTRSGHVTTTAYTDGDAKWYSDDFAVTAGSTYTFSDKYKSTIDTLIYIQFNVGGTFQYAFLGTAPATPNWSTATHNFTAPAGATSASVFHVIAGVGELWTDDVSVTATTTVVPPINTDGNLIINPSAETANANQPVSWNQGKWGSNTAIFDYATDAQDGTKGLHLTVNNYVDGDAKWYNDAVNVLGDSQYTLSHYYKSTAVTSTILQYVSTTGVYSYVVLGSNPVAATWTKVDYTFVVPEGAKSVSVFHILAANGELWTDNYKLINVPVTGDTSHIPNGSLEEVNPTNANQPNKWTSSSWGTNDAVFAYLKTGGYNGSSHAVQVTMTTYTDGDAKWLNNAIQLTPGANYKFTDYYKSNVDTRVVLDITMSDGSTQYLELPGTPASADWTQYSGTFTMPAGAVSVSVFHMLTAVGFLITDQYDINQYNPTPFNNGLITLTFDDGWEDNVTTTLPLLTQYGYSTDQFYATTYIQNAEMGEAAAIATINQFIAAGHEINSHTVTHPDLTTLTSEQSLAELTESKAYLQSKFNIQNYFATPYGAYNAAVKAQIMANYSLHRTVDVGYNSKDNFDITRLKVQNILTTTTAAEVASWVAQAQAEKTWLILVFHRVATDPGDYDTTPAKFADMLTAIHASGIEVKNITQALAELQPQL